MISAWYWLTPVFVVLDWLFDLNWRVAGLDEPPLRAVYYLGCLVCACLISWRPATAPWVGLAESVINFTLLIVGVWLSLVAAPAAIADSQPIQVMTLGRLVNFLLVGTILVLSFNRSIAAMRRGPGPP